MGSRLESNSNSVRKRIANHTFEDEDGEEYQDSKFGGFGDYFRRKRIKLQNLDADIRAQAGDKPQIFNGIVAHVNGYTQPSLNDLHTLIVEHGGGFLQYMDGKTTVTHIIASALTPKKAVEFRKYRVVKPAWVVESIAAGKLLPWNNFRVVDEGEKQKVLAFDGGGVVSSTPSKTKGYRDQSDNSWYTDQLRASQHVVPAGSSTPTPSSTRRSRFSRQRMPTPDDGIEDLPPSHQPEPLSFEHESQIQQSNETVTPPKTSPSLEAVLDKTGYVFDIDDADDQDSLYADPTPRPRLRAQQQASKHENVAAVSNDKKPLTAEEHNAILLSDPKIRKSTVVDPNFLEQYYRESRLHHLSTWKAELKSQLQALANEKSSSQTLAQKRPPGARRYVLHVDFDCFFAAVSLKNYPQYKDKPVAVAHGNSSGSEIASCNYPARKFGVKNGMWMKRAQERCPELKILPYDFPAYEKASMAFYDAILAMGGLVQSVSIDEALVDISNMCISAGGSNGSIFREQCMAEGLAKTLRDQVQATTGLSVSVGIGSSILLAKVALRRAKPDGQYHIKPENVLDFVGSLPVQDLPGVAYSIGGKLEELGVKYVKDIRELSKERIVQALGPKTGEKLWEYSRGIDRQEVGEQVIRKSVSAEVNWGVRFANQEQVDEFMGNLCGELQKRLLKEKVKGKQFTLKIMRRSPDAPLDPPKHLGHGKCDTFNKSIVLGVATNAKEILTKEALGILKGFGFSPGELRGIGVQMTKLDAMRSATDGNLDGSQRRLQFKTGTKTVIQEARIPHQPVKIVDADPIQDDPETPKKNKGAAGDEHVAFGPTELNHSTPSRRPLNMMGTQFIMPTQVDPKILAELPEDIRSKLLRQTRQSSPTPAGRAAPTKSGPFPLTALPAQSQLDPDILAALPPDVRAEVLAQYAAGATPRSPSGRKMRADQTILPQSPCKNRIIGIPAKRPIAVPVKRGRGRPPRSAQLAAAALASAKDKLGRTLTQANFISIKNPAREKSRENSLDAQVDAVNFNNDNDFLNPTTAAAPGITTKGKGKAKANPAPQNPPPEDPTLDDLDLDADFLRALPPDLREELIQDRLRLKKRALAEQQARAAALAAAAAAAASKPAAPEPHTVTITRPVVPTFTRKNLHRAPDLRAAVSDWVKAFADEGPLREDMRALKKYLARVVGVERDLAKAVGLVKWLEWVVSDKADDGGGKDEWGKAIEKVKDGVQRAAGKRGLGRVSFA